MTSDRPGLTIVIEVVLLLPAARAEKVMVTKVPVPVGPPVPPSIPCANPEITPVVLFTVAVLS